MLFGRDEEEGRRMGKFVVDWKGFGVQQRVASNGGSQVPTEDFVRVRNNVVGFQIDELNRASVTHMYLNREVTGGNEALRSSMDEIGQNIKKIVEELRESKVPFKYYQDID